MVRWSLALMALILVNAANADLVQLVPLHDTSIYESSNSRSNGGGAVLFTGTNSVGSPRRALLWFDVAGNIPAGATIESVTLSLVVASFAGSGGAGGDDPTTYLTSMHRLTQDWGEGTAGTGTGATGSGQGFETPADGTSATWSHAFFDNIPWANAGGDFLTQPSATQLVSGSIDNTFVWGSNDALVADVQEWLDHPENNFGWIMIGEETISQSFRSFYSREAADTALRPFLTVNFTPIPEPSPFFILAYVASLGIGIRCVRRRTRLARDVRKC